MSETNKVVSIDSVWRSPEIPLSSELNRASALGLRLGVLTIDIGFEEIAALHGYAVAAEVADQAFERLSRAVRRSDPKCRPSEGSFVLVLPGLGAMGDARLVAEGVVRAIGSAYEIETREIVPLIRVGIAVSPDHGSSASALLKRSATALQEARSDGVVIRMSDGPRFGMIRAGFQGVARRSRSTDKGIWLGRRKSRVERAVGTAEAEAVSF